MDGWVGWRAGLGIFIDVYGEEINLDKLQEVVLDIVRWWFSYLVMGGNRQRSNYHPHILN